MPVITKINAIIKSIRRYSEGIYLIEFIVPKRNTRFKAGQFLHLTLDEFDPTTGFWPESRVFSIASEPKQDKLEIIYSVKGKYTKRMESELCEGKEYWLKLPYGDFIVDNYIENESRVAFIAGGTGISPFVPYLKQYLKGEVNKPKTIKLYYGVRKASMIIYKNLLIELSRYTNIELEIYCENTNSIEQLPVKKGMFNISNIVNGIVESDYDKSFISGPPKMINLFKEDLINNNYSMSNIIIDEWE